jgi:hypothetical protein
MNVNRSWTLKSCKKNLNRHQFTWSICPASKAKRCVTVMEDGPAANRSVRTVQSTNSQIAWVAALWAGRPDSMCRKVVRVLTQITQASAQMGGSQNQRRRGNQLPI